MTNEELQQNIKNYQTQKSEKNFSILREEFLPMEGLNVCF
jgi:hypothetical protein